MVLLFPSLVKFKSEEDREFFKPRCHMFYRERCISVPDGLPKWSGMQDQSDLIEDTPKEAVQAYERKKLKEKEERAKEKEKENRDGDGEKKE